MELAWILGCRNLIIESDNVDALRLIQQRSTISGPFTIINYIHQLCDKDWRLDFSKLKPKRVPFPISPISSPTFVVSVILDSASLSGVKRKFDCEL
ncbi:hypothetical protein GQ457_02G041230 [Hibiscus cannabinus]